MPLSLARVDYCKGLLVGLQKKTFRQLQLIQNAAARILTRTRKSRTRSLHWLPVKFRIDFKLILLVYISLNGLGPKLLQIWTEYKPNLSYPIWTEYKPNLYKPITEYKPNRPLSSGVQNTQIKYLNKSTDKYYRILLQ